MPSIISQTFTEVGNSIKDAYGHVIHGDDPGIYETLVFIARSKPVPVKIPVSSIQEDYVERFDLGMTFVEVNDRAFVKDVIPDSDAERAGIRPQDCLQLAIVPAWKFEGRSDKDGKSIKYALECEKNGMRTSFEELRDIFEHCTIRHSKEEVLFTSPSNMDGKGKKERSFRQTLRSTTQEMVGRCSSMSLNSVYSGVSPISPTEHHPVFMVFRHTHSRKKNMGNPHVGLPSFRLDDECERAASIIRRLAPTVDTKHEEDAWDEIVNGATSFLPKEHSCKSETGGAPEDQNTVEASTIRGMIQNALGLAFVRASKVVLGLSFHFGSGIVISRLEDGSWSAPSAIGMYGAGLGLQFGLEVADYIFIIQTSDALDHFRRGTNYTLGGNMGAAVGGMGREAFGAASVSLRDNAAGGEKKEEGNALNLAPIVAYAKSQGLYFGVSFEGSKIFVREDINHRTYQFSTGKECSTDEILSGSVPPPREAEDLYATLHNVEFAHEISQLPRPPEILQKDLRKNWQFDTESIFSAYKDGEFVPLHFLSELSDSELKELNQFEAEFKSFMYEGVAIHRVVHCAVGGGNDTIEKRTLWLMLPEIGSLRLGFLSTDQGSVLGGDDNASIMTDTKSTGSSTDRSNHVEGNLSRKFSIDLTNVVSVERCPTTKNPQNVDGSKLIRIKSTTGKTLDFIANNIPESVVLFCGLKLLVEKETTRLGIRGGNPMGQLTVPEVWTQDTDEAMGESTDNNSLLSYPIQEQERAVNMEILVRNDDIPKMTPEKLMPQDRSMNASFGNFSNSSYDNSGDFEATFSLENAPAPRYVQGQLLYTDIATNVTVPLPLPLCRALFLDSSSPLLKQWESNRGDFKFCHGDWRFKPSSPRSVSDLQEFELIANGKMTGGYRTTTFERVRKAQVVSLSETWIVDIDEDDTFVFTIVERMPRRGFSVRLRAAIRPSTISSCDVSIVGEVVPLGKNTTDQSIVHRAFLLLTEEMKERYGEEGKGLLAGLLQIVQSFKSEINSRTDDFAQFNIDMNSPSDEFEQFNTDINSANNDFAQFNNDMNSANNDFAQFNNDMNIANNDFAQFNDSDNIDFAQFDNHIASPINDFSQQQSFTQQQDFNQQHDFNQQPDFDEQHTFGQPQVFNQQHNFVQQHDFSLHQNFPSDGWISNTTGDKVGVIADGNQNHVLIADMEKSNFKSQARIRGNSMAELRSDGKAENKSSSELPASNTKKLDITTPKRKQKKMDIAERPSTPSMQQRMSKPPDTRLYQKQSMVSSISNEFAPLSEDMSEFGPVNPNPIKIDVRPLPKIRLDLMPSPREVDEEDEDEDSRF